MKKNGFTLVELLAVIIILAVIALIATPIVLDVVDSAKKSAAERSAFGFAKAAQNYWFENEFAMLTDSTLDHLDEAEVEDIEVGGAAPTGCESVTYDAQGRVSFTGCVFGDYQFDCTSGVIGDAVLVED